MRAFNEALYDDRQLNLGFRSQALLRFVGPESAWLSPAHGRLGTLYVNIEDFIKYSRVIDSEESSIDAASFASRRTVRRTVALGQVRIPVKVRVFRRREGIRRRVLPLWVSGARTRSQ